MASWMASYRLEPAVDRDSPFSWQMLEGIMPPDEASGNQYQNNYDLFRQFIDFDDELATTSSFEEINGGHTTTTSLSDNLFVDPFSNQAERPKTSSAISSADEHDFPSASSFEFVDPPAEIPALNGARQLRPSARDSSSSALADLAVQRLEQVSIHSPVKMEPPPALQASVSPTAIQSSSPTKRQSKKMIEAISSTIKKATTLRKGRKQAQPPVERSASPTLEHPPMAIKGRRRRKGGNDESSYQAAAPYSNHHSSNSEGFIHGYCEDPFSDFLQTNAASDVRYYGQNGIGDATSMLPLGNGRRVKSEQELYQSAHSASPKAVIVPDGTAAAHIAAGSWQQQIPSNSSIPEQQWAVPAGQGYILGQEGGWWEGINVFSEAKNASLMHQTMSSQHADLPYDYEYPPPGLDAALMIHMSQPGLMPDRTSLPQTYLPPPPPIPAAERERSSRPPKARSSGTRHQNMSPSPMRKTRGPSASPQPAAQSQSQASTHQRRHSSAGSISSARSASARGANGASAPGTPGGGVRKRRSRDANLASSGGGGSDNMGFVNFTPSDGNILMTGVAPSGSSKTKARREKEAQERRRKLSEAAMKAVVAAGGDVDKLIQEGFVF